MDNRRSTRSTLLPAARVLAVSDAPLRDLHRTPDRTASRLHVFLWRLTTFLLMGPFVFLSTPLSAQSATQWPKDGHGPILALTQPSAGIAAVPQAAVPSSAKGTKGAARAAQTSQPPLQLPEFEIATVKFVDMNGEILNMCSIRPGGRLDIRGWDLNTLIAAAFRPERISGGADWTRSQRFDIQAVPPEDMRASITDLRTRPFIADPRLRQMLQALLTSRFQLRFHYETVTSDAYVLQTGGKPPAFRPTSIDPSRANSLGWQPITLDHGHWVLQGATMAALAHALSGTLGIRVLDETGLTGAYDYKQRGIYDEAPTVGQDLGPSLLHFLAELKLTLRKVTRPVDVFVIDDAKRPLPD